MAPVREDLGDECRRLDARLPAGEAAEFTGIADGAGDIARAQAGGILLDLDWAGGLIDQGVEQFLDAQRTAGGDVERGAAGDVFAVPHSAT